MSGRQWIAAVLAVVVISGMVAGPVTAADELDGFDGKQSGAVEQLDGIFASTPPYVITYGADELPGFYISYTEGDRSKLIDWIDASDDRELVSEDNGSRRALVTAPVADVLGGVRIDGFVPRWFGAGLEGKDYVETVDVNVRLEYVEPVDSLINESGYERPLPSVAVSGAWSPEGVAFDSDAEEANLSDVRSNISADDVDVDGSGLTAAVIDTGANVGDGEIYGNGSAGSSIRISEAKNFITDESVNTSADNPDWSVVADGNGHGSWVASAIAANASGDEHDGIAPGADLLVARALDDDGSGSTEDIVDAIEWAEANGADVISMSLGSPVYSPTIQAEIEEALEGNVSVVVVAAGNSRMNPAVRYVASPADAPVDGVIAVGATNTSTPATASSAYFSNVGPDTGTRDLSNGATVGQAPDVAAPGMKVVAPTLTEGGARQNQVLSGTSMATPIVTGAILLALESNPSWQNDTDRIRDELEATSTAMPNAGVTEVGHGMINASNLVDDVDEDEDQREARSDEAIGRDQANRAYSDSNVVRPLRELVS